MIQADGIGMHHLFRADRKEGFMDGPEPEISLAAVDQTAMEETAPVIIVKRVGEAGGAILPGLFCCISPAGSKDLVQIATDTDVVIQGNKAEGEVAGYIKAPRCDDRFVESHGNKFIKGLKKILNGPHHTKNSEETKKTSKGQPLVSQSLQPSYRGKTQT